MGSSPTNPVTSEFGLQLLIDDADPLDVYAAMSYSQEDPYAVRVTFRAGGRHADEAVEWTFARQLLTDGITASCGEGDVQVWPSERDPGSLVCLGLTSPSGRALFEMPLRELVEFLTRTYALVPTGTESEFVDVDVELTQLLRDEY